MESKINEIGSRPPQQNVTLTPEMIARHIILNHLNILIKNLEQKIDVIKPLNDIIKEINKLFNSNIEEIEQNAKQNSITKKIKEIYDLIK